MTRKELIKRFRLHHEECERRFKVYEDSGYHHALKLQMPPFPHELLNLRCEAKTRAGTPCKRSDIYLNGRCKLHGGLSTGPKTIQGKSASSRNGLRPKKKRTP